MEAAALIALITGIVSLITYVYKAHDANKTEQAPAKKAEAIDHAFINHDPIVESLVLESTADRLRRYHIETGNHGNPR